MNNKRIKKREPFKLYKPEQNHKKRNFNWVLRGMLLIIEGKKKIRLSLGIISCYAILTLKHTFLVRFGHQKGQMVHFQLKCRIGCQKL
jgi:hypothetical protein